MKEEYELELKQNESHFVYNLLDKGNEIGHIIFDIEGSVMHVDNTVVSKEYQNQGLASVLFNSMIKYAKENNYKVAPHCSYVAIKMKKDKLEDMIDPNMPAENYSCKIG